MPDSPETGDHSANAKPHSRFRGRDGVTIDERDQPPADRSEIVEMEAAAIDAQPSQLDLFASVDNGAYIAEIGGLPPITAHSSLDLARTDFRRQLERSNRPHNTIDSYNYDLQKLEDIIGPKPINRIERHDIARFLGDANSKTTRKRRLTSVRQFFRYLIDEAKVLKFDPTDGYYPHPISLRSPVPLFEDEQLALLNAAMADEAWSSLAIWLMLRLGLTRSELLALKRDHVDRTTPTAPVVYVVYEELTKQSKDRRLAANAEFSQLYDAYLAERDPQDIVFPVGPQAVNGMVERVRKLARITKDVTPQTLRTTFAVEQAKAGADQQQLLELLGLVNDPRNRTSVDRYLALAASPLEIAHPESS